MKALTATEFNFPGQKSVYHGKVRDVYNINGEKLVMVATDRISAFDVVLPKGIPFKGQMLNQIAAKFLDATTDICPNWKMATPDPMVTVGVMCEGFPVEMIVRGYLCGSAWRAYKSGVREICGVKLPEGMKENQKFPEPIITPTTKAEIGEHDADISKEEILAQGLATPEEYAVLEQYTMALFKRGTEIAAERGLILVDTKYEFGKHDGKIYLMDEIHTPDSSRYFYSEGYEERFANGEPQKQLSKEFVREWLMDNGFQGKEGQQVPEMTDEIVTSISERYIELYEHITGEKFVESIRQAQQEPYRVRRIERQIRQLTAEKAHTQGIKEKLYGDYAEEILTREDFLNYNELYSKRIEEYDRKITELEAEQRNLQTAPNAYPFLDVYRKYQKLEEITRPMVVELIEKIEVYEGNRVEITFRFHDEIADLLEELHQKQMGQREVSA